MRTGSGWAGGATAMENRGRPGGPGTEAPRWSTPKQRGRAAAREEGSVSRWSTPK